MTPQHHHQKPTKTPSRSPPSTTTTTTTTSSSRKRLLSTHHKPKQCPGPGPPTIPSDDDLLLYPQKKTRDLPNMSDCHGCRLRINHTNPKHRLQTLDSVWRIVLLCRKCIKRVELGQTCPYCFKQTANSVCFTCRDCERKIHKECVVEYGDSSPWSYCKSESGLRLEGFSVCVDCWVPKMFRNSITIRRRKRIGKKGGGKSLEEVAKDANWLAGRKVVMALRVQRKALRKAVVARNASELAKRAIDLVVEKDKDGKRVEGLARSGSTSSMKGSEVSTVNKAVDDEELAFQLHRSMNSSRRIFKNLCSLNMSCLDVPERRDESNTSDEVDKFKPELITYKRRKLKKEFKTYQRGCLKRKIVQENGELDKLKAELITYKRRKLKKELKTYKRGCIKRKIFQENGEVDKFKPELITYKRRKLKKELKTYKRGCIKRKIFQENGEVDSSAVVVNN